MLWGLEKALWIRDLIAIDCRQQEFGLIRDGWMKNKGCSPWVAAPDGSYLSSGDNREGPKVRSSLSLRLHFKTAGRLWFTYR
jgi:hypothetical protein